jgi:hypothetical protein
MTLRFIDFKTSEPQNIEGYIRFAQFVLIRLSGKNKLYWLWERLPAAII